MFQSLYPEICADESKLYQEKAILMKINTSLNSFNIFQLDKLYVWQSTSFDMTTSTSWGEISFSQVRRCMLMSYKHAPVNQI